MIVEDCAQAIGAQHGGQNVGRVGQVAATSFYPTKNLGALGDGGALLTNDELIAIRAKMLRNYGQSSSYLHDKRGLNSRLDELQAAILDDANTIGPRMRIKDARQTFAGLWIRQLLEHKPIEVWGGKQLRDFTDVDDAVEAFLMVAASSSTKGQVYNLGGSEVIELADLAKRMVEINGGGEYSVCEFPADRRAIDIGDYYADFSKIRSELGWAPRKPLRETIESTLNYYREFISHYV